ncbi:MAG: hypothetical protein IPN78_18915 [Candidatus Accumulibacter sp.]|nr:hypothetical protein [Candidatus Accumulibacter propinquus]
MRLLDRCLVLAQTGAHSAVAAEMAKMAPTVDKTAVNTATRESKAVATMLSDVFDCS